MPWRKQNKTNHLPYRESNRDSCVGQAVASRYTGWAIPVLTLYFISNFSNGIASDLGLQESTLIFEQIPYVLGKSSTDLSPEKCSNTISTEEKHTIQGLRSTGW
jgi:hypothetical protein